MIARDAESQALQLPTSFVDFQTNSFGDEMRTVNCDLSDLNIPTNEFDQLLLQNLKDIPLSLDCLSMDYEGPTNHKQNGSELSSFIALASSSTANTTHPLSELTNVFADDSSAKQMTTCSSVDNGAALPMQFEPNFLSFFQSLPISAPGQMVSFGMGTSSPDPLQSQPQRDGDLTPPFSGGSTPQSQSRAVSPTWSESSGNMSTSSLSGLSRARKLSGGGGGGSNPLPRHKRPSHRRAEVKRRDKIKTSLDEIKSSVPSLQDKGKLSESAILFKAADYIHQLKDGVSDRGRKAAELRREIQSLSEEIHSFQETLPAGGLKHEEPQHRGLDQLYSDWLAQQTRLSTKHYIFHSITSSLFDSFKKVMGDACTLDSLACRLKEWQTRCLSLPVLRKQILKGMLKLTRDSSMASLHKDLDLDSSVDGDS